MEYFLKHRDDIITVCDFDPDGNMRSWADRIEDMDIAPLAYRTSPDWLKRWWNSRKIPVSQGRIEHMLSAKGLLGPGEFLLKNLGLSLTDHYWICPLDKDLRWKDINLFENDFKEDLVSGKSISSGWDNNSFSPNSSLKGELEKTWVVRNGRRKLIKGNSGKLSSESINEVIATELHQAQGYKNHCKYSLIRIKDKPYDYGCISEAFTSGRLELVSAYDLITSVPRVEKSLYEHLIDTAAMHGADREELRASLEYQILTDFILTNTDRHMDNIAFLRDTQTLQLICMAPIFDSGRSLFANSVVAVADEEFREIQTNSFAQTEAQLLGFVTDQSLVDRSKLLPPERVEELYRKDSKITEYRVSAVRKAYEKKLDMFEEYLRKRMI